MEVQVKSYCQNGTGQFRKFMVLAEPAPDAEVKRVGAGHL